MKRIPRQFEKIWVQCLYVGVCALFFFLFSIVYVPFDMFDRLSMGRGLFYSNVAILTAIVFGVILIFRCIFYLGFRSLGHSWISYIFWCFLELIILTFFLALFINLRAHDGTVYFADVARCLQYSVLILMYPYVIITILVATLCADKPGEEKQNTIRFLDSSHKFKLAVVRDAILYIGANENYVEIHYLDESGVRKYQLRSTMKAIEPIAEKNLLRRCHRSYFVNPTHVKALRKERDGQMSIELDTAGISIPVSKKYYSELAGII